MNHKSELKIGKIPYPSCAKSCGGSKDKDKDVAFEVFYALSRASYM